MALKQTLAQFQCCIQPKIKICFVIVVIFNVVAAGSKLMLFRNHRDYLSLKSLNTLAGHALIRVT